VEEEEIEVYNCYYMKNTQKGFAGLILLVIVGIVVVGSGVFIYSKSKEINPSTPFINDAQKEINSAESLFPEVFGDYTLYISNLKKVQIDEECRNVEDSSDLKSTGITGEVCIKTFIGQYRKTSENKVVFVHLNKVISGKDIYELIFNKMSKKDVLGKYSIFRIEQHELAWVPFSSFDFIFTQEGIWTTDSDGGESMSYKQKATGSNPITQYFINKYPPATLVVPAPVPVSKKSSVIPPTIPSFETDPSNHRALINENFKELQNVLVDLDKDGVKELFILSYVPIPGSEDLAKIGNGVYKKISSGWTRIFYSDSLYSNPEKYPENISVYVTKKDGFDQLMMRLTIKDAQGNSKTNDVPLTYKDNYLHGI